MFFFKLLFFYVFDLNFALYFSFLFYLSNHSTLICFVSKTLKAKAIKKMVHSSNRKQSK